VSPALVAPADGSFRGRVKKPAPHSYLPVEYAPLRRKVQRAVRSPSFTARFFAQGRADKVALHEHADRAMVTEGWPT
jgi:hypothetical protein